MGTVVVVLVPGPAGRLAVRAWFDVAAHCENEPLGRCSDLRDSEIEGLAVPCGRLAESAHLANVLARGGLNLACRGCVVLMTEGSDASAHGASVPAVSEGIGDDEL
jgi:hypothetical protein